MIQDTLRVLAEQPDRSGWLIGAAVIAIILIAIKITFFPDPETGNPFAIPGSGEVVDVYGTEDELEREFGPGDGVEIEPARET